MAEKNKAKKIEVTNKPHKASDIAIPVSLDLFLLAIGILLLILSDKIVTFIGVIIGACLLTYAAFNIIKYARTEEKRANDVPTLIAGIAVGIVGAFVLLKMDLIREVFSIAIGAVLTISSILRLQDAMKLQKTNPKVAKTPLYLSLITLVLGILCLVGRVMFDTIIFQFVGVLMILFAVMDMTGSVTLYKKR